MNITIKQVAVRDLHATVPDDEPHPVWDVLAEDSSGSVYYSESVFDTLEEATAFAKEQASAPYEFSWWEDKELAPAHIGVLVGDWLAVKEPA